MYALCMLSMHCQLVDALPVHGVQFCNVVTYTLGLLYCARDSSSGCDMSIFFTVYNVSNELALIGTPEKQSCK